MNDLNRSVTLTLTADLRRAQQAFHTEIRNFTLAVHFLVGLRNAAAWHVLRNRCIMKQVMY
jgi:hypothetical protein